MKLDLTEILNKRRESLDFEFALDPAANDEFPRLPYGEEYAAPPRVRVRAVDINGVIRIDVDAEAELICACTRCLDEVRRPLAVSFRRYAGQSANAVFGDEDDEGDDVLAIKDSAVDADLDIMEELALAAPDVVLCSEDCPGLCPRCGKKIGAGCSCEAQTEEKRDDPRLDVFRRLLETMEDD